jgi:tetratricopeptide (TPR) repeat protein
LTFSQAQEQREDDLGDVSDAFQIAFFEALQQKGIENYDKAIYLLLGCREQEPENAAVYFELGKNYFELDKFQLSEASLLKANTLKPNNRWILEELYHVYNYQKKTAQTIDILIELNTITSTYSNELINTYYHNNQYNKAITLIEQLDSKLGLDKTREQLRYNIYDYTQNYKDQINYIERKISKASETDYVKLIYTYIKLKKLNQGYDTAQRFAAAYPKSDVPYLSLYKFYISKNNTEKAINAMTIVLNSNTINEDNKYKLLNDFLSYTEQHLDFLPELEKATKVYPNTTIIGKLALLYKDNNTQKSASYIDLATKNASNSYNDLKLIGNLLLEEQKYDAALKNSQEALELYPAQPIFYLQQAKAYNYYKQPQKALESLEFGLDYLIENPAMEREFYKEFAKAYHILNDTKNEQNYLNKAKDNKG